MRRAGFTLLEMMAVTVLTALVFAAAVDFYIDLTQASRAAIEGVRGYRRAAAIVDRVARDLEAAVLLKRPSEVKDPLSYPWIFFADTNGAYGAEQLLFVSRGRLPRASALRESDLELVAYALRNRGDGSFALVRWSAPHLTDRMPEFPPRDAAGTQVLAEGVAAFGVKLLGQEGQWVASWDSSQVLHADDLPLAAEISVELLPEDEEGNPLAPDQAAAQSSPPVVATRRVLLPLRPLDLEKELNPDAATGGDESGDDTGDDTDGLDDTSGAQQGMHGPTGSQGAQGPAGAGDEGFPQ